MTRGQVVHVVRSDQFAGVERYIADVARALDRRGWGVRVIGGDAHQMHRELPASVRFLTAATTASVVRALWSTASVDVVHAHMTAAELPAALLKRRLGGRLVVTRHFAARRGASLPGRLARPVVARQVDTQIAISQFVADRVDGVSTVIHNAVADADGGGQAQDRDPVVLVVQRLEPEKDTATALHAWGRSSLPQRGWRLVIHGRGSQLRALSDLADRLGIAGSTTFAGYTESPRQAMRGASVFLATAPAEPFGLAVVEAMAEGTPVVAARGGAHEETVGVGGLFFTPGDADACAALLNDVAQSAAQRVTLGSGLRQRQREQFGIDRHVDRLEAVYSDGGPPRG